MLKIYSKMFAKSFFIQSLWNFERLQNIGFLFVLKPFIDKVNGDKEKRKEALLRHTGFFNTHPYMANIIIAITARMEGEIAEKNDENDATVTKVNAIKNTLAGPLAAIGDSFFWGTLRPVAAFTSIFFVILFARTLDSSYSWIVPIIFIVLYNSIHIPVRYWMFFVSLKLDKDSLGVISKLEFKFLGDIARCIGLLIIFASLFFYFKVFGFGPGNVVFFGSLAPDAVVFGVVLLASFLSGRLSATFMFYCVVLLCIFMSYLGI